MNPSRLGLAAVAAGLAALSGCEGDSAGPAPVVPPPPPPAELSASFQAERADLAEGEGVEIGFEYRVTGLHRPFVLEIRLAGGGELPEDVEVAGTAVPLSPGEDISGEAVLTVVSSPDQNFAEGEEILQFEFVPSETGVVRTDFGPPVEVAVADTPYRPCDGVVLRGTGVEREPRPQEESLHTLGTTLTLDLTGPGRDTTFELRGPYLEFIPGAREPYSVAGFGIRDWRIETDGPAYRHRMGITWPSADYLTALLVPPPEEPPEGEEPAPPPEADARLVFAVVGPSCPADSVLTCDADGCYPTAEIQ